jgi:putative peptidoglycan lipid II flippase
VRHSADEPDGDHGNQAPPAPQLEDGWSIPSIFGRTLVGESLIHTEADPLAIPSPQPPMSAPFTTHEPQWGATTYGGPARLRPRPDVNHAAIAPAADPVFDAAFESAPRPADQTTGAAPRTRSERHAQSSRSTKTVLASSRTMAIASLASRVTGFLRSVALTAALGTGLAGDAYNGANSFPNSVYELLLGGVLSSVLIPLLVHAQERDEDGGEAYTQRLLSIAATVLGLATLVAVACAPYIAAAFVSPGPQRTLTSTFATLLLPEIFFYGLGAMFTAVLNTRHVYGPGAWAPLANNAIILVTVAIFLGMPGPKTLDPTTMTTAQVLVIGVGTTLGIVAQALVLLPSLKNVGFRWQWRFRGTPNEAGRLKQAGALSGWVLGYVVASQVGVLVVTKVAFSLGKKYHHGVSTFAQADLLFQVPFGIIGVSLLTAIMPRMARAAAQNDTAAVVEDITLGARWSALALVPITAGLIVLGPAFATVVFAHGRTSIPDARLIGVALAWSAFGLVPFAFVMLQLRVFYAMKDGRTPTLINIFMVATKVVLVIVGEQVLHGDAAVIALNVSTSASYVIGAIIGHILLRRRMGPLGFGPVLNAVTKIGVASAVGGVVAFGFVYGSIDLFGHGRGGALAGLATGSIVGLAVMALIAWQLRIPEIRQLAGRLHRESAPT